MSVRLIIGQAGEGGLGTNYWISTRGNAPTDTRQYTSLITNIDVDNQDNIYSARTTYIHPTISDLFIELYKVNRYGEMQWSRRLTAAGLDFTGGFDDQNLENRGLAVNKTNGDIHIVGVTGGNNFLLVKYDTSGTLQWQRGLDQTEDLIGMDVDVDSSGNVYVCGFLGMGLDSFSSYYYHGFVAKYNSSGTLQWQRRIGDPVTDLDFSVKCFSISVTASGDVYASCDSPSGGPINLFKLNTSGTLQWRIRPTSPGFYGTGGDLITDSSGNVYWLATTIDNPDGGSFDYILGKFNSSGVAQWGRAIGSVDTFDLAPYSLDIDTSGNVYVCGGTTSGYKTNILKFDSSGNLQWTRLLDAEGITLLTAKSIRASRVEDAYYLHQGGRYIRLPGDGTLTGSYPQISGEYYINRYYSSYTATVPIAVSNTASTVAVSTSTLTGITPSLTSSSLSYNTSKISILPDPNYWHVTFSSLNLSSSSSATVVDSSENVYIIGRTTAAGGAGSDDIYFAKLNNLGHVQWQRSLGSVAEDGTFGSGPGITVDSSLNVYITGSTGSPPASIVAKYNSSGTLQWQRQITSVSTILEAITVDSSGNVYALGQSNATGTQGSYDFFIVKYNTSGVLQWQRGIGTSSSFTEVARAIAVDSSGNVHIAGIRADTTGFFIAKYDTNGTLSWQREISMSIGGGTGISIDNSTGDVYVSGFDDTDFVLFKYNSSGSLTWQRKLAGANRQGSVRVKVTSNGVYIAGTHNVNDTLTANPYIVIAYYSTGGTLQWQRVLDLDLTTVGGIGSLDLVNDTIYISGRASTTVCTVSRLTAETFRAGSFTYEQSFLTGSTPTYTSSTGAWTGYTRTLSESAGSLTSNTRSLTSTKTGYTWTGNYWIDLIGGAGADRGKAVFMDNSRRSDTNILYVVGHTVSSGNTNAFIARSDDYGKIKWQLSYGGADFDEANGVIADASENIYIVGTSNSTGGAGSFDLVIAKYDNSDNIQWQRSLGGTGTEEGFGVVLDSTDNVYVTGTTTSQGAGGNELLLAKYNSSGTIQWQRSLGGTGSEWGYGISVDGSNNIYVVGITTTQGTGGNDLLLAKYNSTGTIQWQRALGGTGTENGYGIAIDSSNNVYVVGSTTSQGAGSADVLLAKYNSSGTLQWQRALGGTGNDVGKAIAIDGVNNIYITGYTTIGGEVRILVAKYTPAGTLVWQRSIGSTGATYDGLGISISSSLDNNEAIYITGYTTASFGQGSDDIILARLPSDGSLTSTYESIVYQPTTLTAATTTLTNTNTTLTDSARTLTDQARTLTNTLTALTSTTRPFYK